MAATGARYSRPVADPHAPELVRSFTDLVRLPAGGGVELVAHPWDGTPHLLDAPRARALAACPGLATLDQHAARIAAREGRDRAAVRAELAALADAGLLVTGTALASRLRAATPPAAPPPEVATLAVITRDRPRDLAVALDGHAENARAHGHAPELLVVEGEVDAPARERTLALLARLAARTGLPVVHAGFPEREAFAAQLARRAGAPLELARFAVANPERCPLDTGAGRNAALLHAAGDLLVFADDDTRARLAPTPGALPGLAVTSRSDPTESWFPGPGAAVLPESALVEASFLGLHASLLGHPVTALAEARRREGLDLDGAGAALFRRLPRRGGHVLTTQTGVAGDTGTGSMWHYLLLGGRTRDRLHASEAAYRHAFQSRLAVRGAVRAAVSDQASIMSLSLGVDAREPAPPFFPVQRNGDGVFALTARVCLPDAFAAFLPWTLEHAPTAPRAASFEAFFATLGKTTTADLVCALIASSQLLTHPEDAPQNLRALGEHLSRLGALPLADFEAHARVLLLRARTVELGQLEAALAAHRGTPAWWARDMARAAAALRAVIADPGMALPVDLAAQRSPDEARRTVQRLVRRHGELLQAWPELRRAARALRGEGVRLGRRIG